MAILGDFEGENPEQIMEKILLRLKSIVKKKKDFQKFTFQLHVLSGLRKLQRIFQQKIKTMPLTFDIDMQIDPIYLDGVKDGVKKGEIKKAALLVENLLLESKLSIKRIAEFVDETETFVLSIKNRLIQDGKLSVTPKSKKTTQK